MSEGDVKPIKDRVADLEKQIQEFTTKFEHGWAKGETVGAAGAATGAAASLTGVSGEATLLSGGFKLANFEYDFMAEREKKKLRSLRQLPDQLAEDIGAAKRLANEGKEAAGRVDRRVSDLSRDVDQKLRRKADLTEVRQANSRQNSQLEGLRSSQVSALRREATQANAAVQHLNDEITRLNSRF